MTSGAPEVYIVNNGWSDDLETTNKCALSHTRSQLGLKSRWNPDDVLGDLGNISENQFRLPSEIFLYITAQGLKLIS